MQYALEVLHIGVTVTHDFREAQSARIVDRGVILTVVEDIVILTADSGNDREVRLEAGRAGHTILIAGELCELFFELQMQVQRTIEESAAADTGSVFVECRVTGSNNFGVFCEAQIVIATQHDNAVPFHLNDRRLA